MAFRHHKFGALVASDPAAAQAQLAELFRVHRTREGVAEALDVDGRTLARWMTKLVDSKLEDPRDTAAVPRRGRPKAA